MPQPLFDLSTDLTIPPVLPAGPAPVDAAGLDLVDVRRLRLALDRSGPRLLDRLFDAAERRACAHGADGLATAGLFGIKESVVKALGGLPSGAAYRDISVEAEADAVVGRDDLPVLLGGVLAGRAAVGASGGAIPGVVAGSIAAGPGLVVSWAVVTSGGRPC